MERKNEILILIRNLLCEMRKASDSVCYSNDAEKLINGCEECNEISAQLAHYRQEYKSLL